MRENDNHPLTNDTYDWEDRPALFALNVTLDQAHLIVTALRTAAVMSRQHGHGEQGRWFSDLAQNVESQTHGEELARQGHD